MFKWTHPHPQSARFVPDDFIGGLFFTNSGSAPHFYYHPQTKFAKVMFSQVFVHRGCLCSGVSLSRGVSVQLGGVSVQEGLCPGRPPIRLRAGGAHPTGMNSCYYILVAVFSCIHAEPSANLLNSLASFFRPKAKL